MGERTFIPILFFLPTGLIFSMCEISTITVLTFVTFKTLLWYLIRNVLLPLRQSVVLEVCLKQEESLTKEIDHESKRNSVFFLKCFELVRANGLHPYGVYDKIYVPVISK